MIKVLIAGDFCPRDRVLKRIANEDADGVLRNVRPYIYNADLAVVNFECPVVKGKTTPISKLGPSLHCPEKSVDLIKEAGFNLVTLANNHFYDQGEKGVNDTISSLNTRKINYIGGGNDLREAKRIFYYVKDNQTVAVINCCEHEFSIASDKQSGSNPMNPIAQWYQIQEAKSQADFVMIIVHGGHEQYNLPSPRMKETYRFFIDSGADAVVNHHQHCYSGYEVYQGKPIFYGLGNFCMDDPRYRNSIWNEGFMVQLTFSETISFELYPYVQGNETEDVQPMSKEDHDAFIQKIENLNEIIMDDDKLNEAYLSWAGKTSAFSMLAFMPYSNKIFSHLAIKGILPSKPSKTRLLTLLNKIECESHRDKILITIKKNI